MVIHVGNETYGLISVIIPAYNAQEYIDECIEIIKIRHLGYGIVRIQHGFHAGRHVPCRLLVLAR